MPKTPHLLKIIPPTDASFILKGDPIPWDNPWHYHPEIELIFCIKGNGTNFVGNAIRKMEEGEILLFGSNLPHTRQRDRTYYEANQHDVPESIILQFNEDFLGKEFLATPEFLHIKNLISRASKGLKFFGKTLETGSQKLLSMPALDKTQRVIELLSILDVLAKSTEYEFLNTIDYVSNAHEKNAQKINRVYEHTIMNFRNPIELSEVAQLTNLSISAFCRYFKIRTRKSYFYYLNEVRVGYACRLLSEGYHNIGQVSYESGFNNLSNFNKQFKKHLHITPTEYLAQTKQKAG